MNNDNLKERLIEAEEKTKKILNKIENTIITENDSISDNKINKLIIWMQEKIK